MTHHVNIRMLVLAFTIVALITTTAVVQAATITVCPSGCEHTSIQSAINAAIPGDTIEVHSGTYYEDVIVNKQLTLFGENQDSTIIDGCGSGNVVLIDHANNCKISGFMIRNSSNGGVGIFLFYSSNNTLMNNNIHSNTCGIHLQKSSNNTITKNTASSNGNGFVVSYSSNNNMITDNIANSNDCGISSRKSNNNTITGNTLQSNRVGIELGFLSNSTVMNNKATSNHVGISLLSSIDNKLKNNNASLNHWGGICLEGSSNNMLTNNNINSNNQYGITLSYASNNNRIYFNNLLNNGNNVYSSGSNNIWNSTLPITYTYNKISYTNYMGNYWGADYAGSDANGDGIGDTPFVIGSDRDNYPLMERFENYVASMEIGSADVRTWGDNGYGQIGDGTTTERHTPVQVSDLSDVVAIAGGNRHTIILKNDGTVWTCGHKYLWSIR